jgi:hypothetical protein
MPSVATLTLYTPPNTDPLTTWQSVVDVCVARGGQLATRAQWCSTGTPFGGQLPDDQWAPISDCTTNNCWVQIGTRVPGDLCKTHYEIAGVDPAWGISGVNLAAVNTNVQCVNVAS